MNERKVRKLQEKYFNESVEYKKDQLLNKIKTLQENTGWESGVKGTYRKEKENGKKVENKRVLQEVFKNTNSK